MLTVVSTMKLNPEARGEWDTLIHERFRSAHDREGWVSGQLLTPVDSPDTRVIVGTWRSRDDGQAWHEDPAFLATRAKLDELQAESQGMASLPTRRLVGLRRTAAACLVATGLCGGDPGDLV